MSESSTAIVWREREINYAYSSRWKKIYATLLTRSQRRGCEEIVFQHLERLTSPNSDSDSQESVFDHVETLYNTWAFDGTILLRCG